MSYQVQIKRLPGNEDIIMPTKATDYASGYDLHAAVDEDLIIEPGQRHLIPTGFAILMPNQMEAQVRPRSGLALKHGITVLNSPGTIDADYRGEVKVLLINLGDEPFTIRRNDRIAQLVFQLVPTIDWVEVDELSESARGAGGFGHTGI